MKRFCTVEDYDGTITAYREQQQDAIDEHIVKKAAAWVWQFAESTKQAVEQHHAKHQQWETDMDAGLDEKETY